MNSLILMKKNTILVVDDNNLESEILSQILKKNGFNTIKAESGENAIEILETIRPDLIISDIVMPGINGYEFCQKVKKDDKLKEIPFILLTYLSTVSDIIRGLESGADSFIIKPYEQDFLLSRISDLLFTSQDNENKNLHVSLFFNGENYVLESAPSKTIQLLLSTYEYVLQKNRELERLNNELLDMHQEMKSKNNQLEKLNKERNYFLGMASHDLRTPLAAIQGYSEMLLEDEDNISKQQESFINSIKSSSDFMLNLVNNILDFSRFESGNIDLNFELTDIVDLVRHTIFINSIIAEKKNIKINFSYDEDIEEIKIDSYKIQQSLNNLLSNAIKFSFKDKSVDVEVRKKERSVLISIKDHGQGIPNEEFDKLFLPFQKTSVKSTDGEKSTGLGLAITKKLIEEHKGKITFESEKDIGSTFYIELPIKK